MEGHGFEEDPTIENARQVLKEASEWREMLKASTNFVDRDRRTRDIYEVIGAIGKQSCEIQNIRIKQLIRERIISLEPEIKSTVIRSLSVKNVPEITRPSLPTSSASKYVPTPLPRVAFLGHKQKGQPFSRGKINNELPPTKKDPGISAARTSAPKRLSRLLETPKKISTESVPIQKLLPIPQYFHIPPPQPEKMLPAVPVVPSCQVLRRFAEKQEKQSEPRGRKVKRRDNVAVVNVETKCVPKKRPDVLKVQVLPSVIIEGKFVRKPRKSNVKLIQMVDVDEVCGKSESLSDSDASIRNKPKPVVYKVMNKDMPVIQKPTSPESGFRRKHTLTDTAKLLTHEDSTQTNGENSSNLTTDRDHLKEFILKVLEEGLVGRLMDLQANKHKKQDVSTETTASLDRVVESRAMETQTSFLSLCADKETSVSSDLDPRKEYRDAGVSASLMEEKESSSVYVQVEGVETVSKAVSPVQELLKEEEVPVRPELVDCATSPVFASKELPEERVPPALNIHKPKRETTPGRRLAFQESSSSSYLTDTTGSTTATTTSTTSGEAQVSEGEYFFNRPFRKAKVEALQSLSEGEIPPDTNYSAPSNDFNISGTLSEGQLPVDLNTTGPSQTTATSGTSDSDAMQAALLSTGEIVLAASPTDGAVSS